MKKYISLFLILTLPLLGWSWGAIGHRVIGKVAELHLTKKARKNIKKVLGHETLAEVSTWMDFIRSDRKYDYMYTWHFVSIPDGQTYEDITPPESGDVIGTIERLTQELQTKKFTHGDEAAALKILIHLVGDIHQPLHVGRAEDRGGNDIKVKWFGESSNLHRVWDSQIIDHTQYSYTEFTDWINHASKKEVGIWQSQNVRVWAQESMNYREKLYDIPDNGYLSYRYSFDHIAMVKQRLLQAGIRLAGLLNEIYG